MRMNFTCVGAVGGLLVAGVASGGAFQGLTMELVNSGDQGNTYRLFADLEAGASVTSVFGTATDELRIEKNINSTWYQNANGGPTSKEINSNFFPFVPSMEWDSYVSIGAYYQNGAPFGSNDLQNSGIDWTGFEGAGDLVVTDGSWFVASGTPQSEALNGQVFLGQFTLQGGNGDVTDLTGQINLMGEDANGLAWTELGATWNDTGSSETGGSNAVPGIGAIAPLCFVGLVRKRRRQG